MRATVEIKIGPIGARFVGAVTLSELDPPNGYRIMGEGQAGVVGFAKGGARVRLADDPAGTLLSYEVDAEVGGRLAQLGGPIIDATAKQLAGKFFQTFGKIVGAPAGGVETRPADGAAPLPMATSPVRSAPVRATSPVAWLLGLIVAGLVGFLIGRSQGAAASDWAGLAIGLLVVIVAAAAFEYGRRAAAPVVTLDARLLRRLLGEEE